MNQRCAVGIDIGGTRLRIGLVNQQLELLGQVTTSEHCRLAPEEMANLIGNLCRSILSTHRGTDILGIGVGYPGPVSDHLGSTLGYSNLRDEGWKQVPLAKMLEQHTGFPVFLDNDANLAGLAEVCLGAGKNFRHIAYLTISTGTGGAIFIDRRLYRGFLGGAGEFGHMVVDLQGSRCQCGNRGCLMSLLSGLGLEHIIREKSCFRRLCGQNDHPADQVKNLVEMYRLGHPAAREALRLLADYLAVAFLNIIHLLNPETIIVGGALGKTLFTHLGVEVRDKLLSILPRELVVGTLIQEAALGDQNGMLGGAILVFDQVKRTGETGIEVFSL